MVKVQFRGNELNVTFDRYRENGRVAMQLSTADGEPWGSATVNISEAPLGDGEVLIKDYSENKGVLAALTKAGIVEPTGKVFHSGYIVAHVCRLLVPAA